MEETTENVVIVHLYRIGRGEGVGGGLSSRFFRLVSTPTRPKTQILFCEEVHHQKKLISAEENKSFSLKTGRKQTRVRFPFLLLSTVHEQNF